MITAWWTRHRQANVAAPTGAATFDVLDVDVRPTGSGWDALLEARAAGLIDGWVRAVQTPSGGLHLHYPGTQQRNGTIRGRHLDFRGQGGYVLLPPSFGQTKAYSREYVTLDQRPGGRPLDWPGIVQLLDPPAPPLGDARRTAPARSATDPTRWLASHVARQPEGNRNNALFWATHRAVEARVADYEPVRPLVLAHERGHAVNMIGFGSGPQRGEDGSLVLVFPMGDAPLSGIAAEDIGKVAAGIFAAGDTYIGQTVSIAGEHLTVTDMAAQLSDAIGETVTYAAVEPDDYRAMGFPGAEDLGNMFQFYRDFNDYFVGERDIDLVRQLNPELMSFRDWLATHADQIPIPPTGDA